MLRNFDCRLEFVFFSAVTSAFQLFTCKLCLQFSGLRMRNFTWNRFPIKNFSDRFLAYTHRGKYILDGRFAPLLFEGVAHVIGLGGFPQILWNSTDGRVLSTKDQDAFCKMLIGSTSWHVSGIEFMCPMLVKSPQKFCCILFPNLIWKTFFPTEQIKSFDFSSV